MGKPVAGLDSPHPRLRVHWPSSSFIFSLTHVPCSSVSSSSRCLSPSRGWCPPAAWKSCTGRRYPGWTSTAPCPSSGQVSRGCMGAVVPQGLSRPWRVVAGRAGPLQIVPQQIQASMRTAAPAARGALGEAVWEAPTRGANCGPGARPLAPLLCFVSSPCACAWVHLEFIEHLLFTRPCLKCFQICFLI